MRRLAAYLLAAILLPALLPGLAAAGEEAPGILYVEYGVGGVCEDPAGVPVRVVGLGLSNSDLIQIDRKRCFQTIRRGVEHQTLEVRCLDAGREEVIPQRVFLDVEGQTCRGLRDGSMPGLKGTATLRLHPSGAEFQLDAPESVEIYLGQPRWDHDWYDLRVTVDPNRETRDRLRERLSNLSHDMLVVPVLLRPIADMTVEVTE